jgi:hypothetical protein
MVRDGTELHVTELIRGLPRAEFGIFEEYRYA